MGSPLHTVSNKHSNDIQLVDFGVGQVKIVWKVRLNFVITRNVFNAGRMLQFTTKMQSLSHCKQHNEERELTSMAATG